MTDQQIEQEIQAKGLTAPRVTPADVDAEIAAEYYFTADDGAQGAFNRVDKNFGGIPTPQALSLLTFCVLVLRNGFTVTGESACASPENFDTEVGRKIARQKAIEKVWPLLGFRLRDKLAQRPQDYRERVLKEASDLAEKITALAKFQGTATFAELAPAEQTRLDRQLSAMASYGEALQDRISAWQP